MIIQLNHHDTKLAREAHHLDNMENTGCTLFGGPPPSYLPTKDNLARFLKRVAWNYGVDSSHPNFDPNLVLIASDFNGVVAYMTTERGETVDVSRRHESTPFDEVKSSILLSIDPSILNYRLIKTHHRLTFDIISQHPDTRYRGEDDGPYFRYTATNGYEIFSRSRMDIHTERVWLLGAKDNRRSGTIPYSDNTKRDRCAYEYHSALSEWILKWKQGGLASWR